MPETDESTLTDEDLTAIAVFGRRCTTFSDRTKVSRNCSCAPVLMLDYICGTRSGINFHAAWNVIAYEHDNRHR